MREAHEKVPMRLVGFCLMSNHFHLLLWPHKDGDLSRWMQWLMTAHVRRYHSHYHSSGHVWQGRFKAFPIQADDHYCTVLRYVERNPLRANMVKRSQDGEWSSLLPNARSGPDGLLCEGPLPKHSQWTRFVNGSSTEPKRKRTSKHCVTVFRGGHPSAIRHGSRQRPSNSDWSPRSDHADAPESRKSRMSPFCVPPFCVPLIFGVELNRFVLRRLAC